LPQPFLTTSKTLKKKGEGPINSELESHKKAASKNPRAHNRHQRFKQKKNVGPLLPGNGVCRGGFIHCREVKNSNDLAVRVPREECVGAFGTDCKMRIGLNPFPRSSLAPSL